MIAFELLAKHAGSPLDSHYTFSKALTTWTLVVQKSWYNIWPNKFVHGCGQVSPSFCFGHSRIIGLADWKAATGGISQVMEQNYSMPLIRCHPPPTQTRSILFIGYFVCQLHVTPCLGKLVLPAANFDRGLGIGFPKFSTKCFQFSLNFHWIGPKADSV